MTQRGPAREGGRVLVEATPHLSAAGAGTAGDEQAVRGSPADTQGDGQPGLTHPEAPEEGRVPHDVRDTAQRPVGRQLTGRQLIGRQLSCGVVGFHPVMAPQRGHQIRVERHAERALRLLDDGLRSGWAQRGGGEGSVPGQPGVDAGPGLLDGGDAHGSGPYAGPLTAPLPFLLRQRRNPAEFVCGLTAR
jgi:hypothetical protein